MLRFRGLLGGIWVTPTISLGVVHIYGIHMAAQNVPEKIDKYQILSVIGKGAMGIVYHAYDPIVKRDVAIKLLSSLDLDEPELISRFEREARLAGGLRHPNIVTIYDLGQFQGRPYIAMEFLIGKDLEAVIKEKQALSVERKVDIILQICKGLHAAHQKGIIHRDIKPANIRLQDDESAKIMDFGIARMGTSQLTKSGYIIGTLQYMSPEQISGEALDVRTDVFSTGVIAYELFTSINPFAGGGAVDIMYRILNIRPKPIHDLPEEYNTELNQIIMRSLEKNRELRYPSAKEMAQDLEEFLFYLKSMKFQPKASRAAAYEEDRTRNITAEELEQIMAQTDHRPTPSTQNTIVSKPQMPPMDLRSQTLPAFGFSTGAAGSKNWSRSKLFGNCAASLDATTKHMARKEVLYSWRASGFAVYWWANFDCKLYRTFAGIFYQPGCNYQATWCRTLDQWKNGWYYSSNNQSEKTNASHIQNGRLQRKRI